MKKINVNMLNKIWEEGQKRVKLNILKDLTVAEIDNINLEELIKFIKVVDGWKFASKQINISENVYTYIRNKYGVTLYRYIVNMFFAKKIYENRKGDDNSE